MSVRAFRGCGLIAALFTPLACADTRAARVAAPVLHDERQTLRVEPASSEPERASAFTRPAPATSAPAAPGAVAPPPRSVFPPSRFDPPVTRTARSGDGIWAADARARLPTDGVPSVYTTTVHPHPIKPFVEVAVVAFDLERVALRLVAGTAEPESKFVAPERRTGLVAPEDLPGLVAVWNGGFKARHGGFGMRIGKDLYVPPRDDACAVLLSEDGGARIGPWAEVRADEYDAFAIRQTPPCLVHAGALHADLATEERSKKWGAAEGGARDIRRSAVALDSRGRTLFYAMGEWTTARDLAVALRAAGADVAAELDINWSFTFFVFFGDAGGRPEARGTLLPKTKAPPRAFVERPAYRDFFYAVLRR